MQLWEVYLVFLIFVPILLTDKVSPSENDKFPLWYQKLRDIDKVLLSPWMHGFDKELKCFTLVQKETKPEKGYYFLHF